MSDGDIKIVGLSSKKAGGTNWKIIGAIVGIIVLSIGVIAGILLVRQNQNVEEKASGNCDNPQTIVQCPAPNGNLYSCTPPDQNNNAQISTCNEAGRIEMCGVGSNVKQYCCPSVGGTWTTVMTACTVATSAATATATATATSTATATATSTATATATATSTSTSAGKTATPTATSTKKATATSTTKATSTSTSKATAKATATGSGTAFPVPETGADFPTIIGAGFGIIMILVSMALAL